MKLTIEVPPEVMELLEERAEVLGADPETLAAVLLAENLRVWKRMTTSNPLRGGRKNRSRLSGENKLDGSE